MLLSPIPRRFTIKFAHFDSWDIFPLRSQGNRVFSTDIRKIGFWKVISRVLNWKPSGIKLTKKKEMLISNPNRFMGLIASAKLSAPMTASIRNPKPNTD
jgi:hypothetical protein